jgi:hypothetical protein
MRKLIAFVLLGTSLVACMRNRGDEVESAESALDSQESVEAEGNVMMAVIDGADMAGVAPATPDQIAARLAANVALRWQPSDCATVDQNGNTITITYNDCTGPRGLRTVNGMLVLVVSVALDGSITVHGESANLTVNDIMLKIKADATYTTSGTGHTITVSTEGSSVGSRGFELDHVGNYTINWDTASQCGSLAGSWSTEATRLDGTTVSRSATANVMRCVGSCPIGTVSRTFRSGTTWTVTFDGTSVAEWSTSTGRSGTIDLPCR